MALTQKYSNFYMIIDLDSFYDPENKRLEMSSLESFLEILCKFICQKLLYFPKSYLCICVKNYTIIQRLRELSLENIPVNYFDVVFPFDLITLNSVRDLKNLQEYFTVIDNMLSLDQSKSNEELLSKFMLNISPNMKFWKECLKGYFISTIEKRKKIDLSGNFLLEQLT